jgi:hypothetical protein
VSLAQKYRARLLLRHILATVGEETSPIESMLIRPSPATYEEMTPGIWVRHQALGELEEQARAELYEFAQ